MVILFLFELYFYTVNKKKAISFINLNIKAKFIEYPLKASILIWNNQFGEAFNLIDEYCNILDSIGSNFKNIYTEKTDSITYC